MASDKNKKYITALNKEYGNAAAHDSHATYNTMSDKMTKCLDVISSGNHKAVLAILITLLLKKKIEPEQDIRLHQNGMNGGFSARELDEQTTTPFLKKHSFPYMASGSGALTRSLEQAVPFDRNYTGKISPQANKGFILNCYSFNPRGRTSPRFSTGLFIKETY